MALESRLFQASFSATLLWSTAIATALLVLASPARAEAVTLVCQNESKYGGSITLRVDYDQKIAYRLQDNGNVWWSAAAMITEGDVTWDGIQFSGSLNRLSGQFTMREKRSTQSSLDPYFFGPCRRATQKF